MSVGVGLIGTGVMGSEHARLLESDIPGARLAGVFDADASRARAAAAGRDSIFQPSILDRVGPHRGSDHRIPGCDSCGADARMPRGGQAGSVREAVGLLGGGSFARGGSGSRPEPQADSGRLHAPVRSRLPRDEADQGRTRHRRRHAAAQRAQECVRPGMVHRIDGADEFVRPRDRHQPMVDWVGDGFRPRRRRVRRRSPHDHDALRSGRDHFDGGLRERGLWLPRPRRACRPLRHGRIGAADAHLPKQGQGRRPFVSAKTGCRALRTPTVCNWPNGSAP